MRSMMMYGFSIMITVLGAVLAMPASAQSGSHVLVRIPFDFSVGNTVLKAGNYKVEELQSGILAFGSDDGSQHQFALTVDSDSTNGSHQPKLVFTKYGNEAFLKKVFLSDANNCQQLLPNNRERSLIQKQISGEELSLLIQPSR